jgi:acyl-coenzyme A thioesterase PaaI-like protein
MNLQKLFAQARDSAFYRTLLNWMLNRMIPFNKPHRFEIVEIGTDSLKVLLPYKKRNFNHIHGIHACAMATVTEYTSGLLLISKLDAKKFRLIMQRLEMDYHYQGKMDAYATYSVTDEWLENNVYTPLQTADSVVITCEVNIYDSARNHLTTGKVFWQVKDWQKVRTKVGG